MNRTAWCSSKPSAGAPNEMADEMSRADKKRWKTVGKSNPGALQDFTASSYRGNYQAHEVSETKAKAKHFRDEFDEPKVN